MLRPLMRAAMALISGNVPYAPPPLPIRGYDAPARFEPFLMPVIGAEADGAGMASGNYGRTTPYVYNARPAMVVVDPVGAASTVRTARLAGHLTSSG